MRRRPRVGEWAARYEPRNTDQDDLWHRKLTKEEIHHSRQGYYGSVSFVDERVGRILAALEERKMLDDTLIVFFSDHGDMLGDHNLWRKTYGYESSAHIPMMMRQAAGMGLRPAGQTIHNPVELRDLTSDVSGCGRGSGSGESRRYESAASCAQSRERLGSYIDLEHNVCYDANHWNGLTDGKWKYIFHAHSGEEQLVHLENDRHELVDLAAAPEHKETLLLLWRGRLVDHLSGRGDQWVQEGKLMLRPKSMMLSPNFPSCKKTLGNVSE
jgi:arylsulfatase